jgi:hypothetical protein
VQVIDAVGHRVPLTLGTPVQNYERKSLREQEDAASRTLYFSFALDPLNPDALGRQKADKPYLDLYRAQLSADGKSADTTRLLRAPVDDRPAIWVLDHGHVAVLRKHKAFSRGGNEIEVYAIPPR